MFSIIIPNYNRGKVIKRAINSVLNQTFSDFELIIVDDCSTDNSLDVISSVEDKRLKFYKLEKNSGAATARNFGIKKSSGEFISFLDSDDFFEPEFLEISGKIISNSKPNVGFMWTGVRYHNQKIAVEKSWQPKIIKNAYITFLYKHNVGTGSGITLKRKVFENCGFFNEKLRAAEDTDFFLRITKVFSFTYSPEILVNVQKTEEDRISKSYQDIGVAYNLFIDDHLKYIDQDKNLQRKYYYKLMWLNFNIGDKKKARYFFRKIPKRKIGFFIKSSLLYGIYELFDNNTAAKIHKKVFRIING